MPRIRSTALALVLALVAAGGPLARPGSAAPSPTLSTLTPRPPVPLPGAPHPPAVPAPPAAPAVARTSPPPTSLPRTGMPVPEQVTAALASLALGLALFAAVHAGPGVRSRRV